ncbi:MAG: tetratricopeptide repeat protein, partial [Acidobacteriota bacterium]
TPAPRPLVLQIDAGSLEPGLASSLRFLLEIESESGGVYTVVDAAAPGPAGLRVVVAGKGPWRLLARGARKEGGTEKGFSTRKFRFSDRKRMIRAVDDLMAALQPELGDGSRELFVPVARTLSKSTRAVDAYLGAVEAIDSGDVPAGRGLLQQALESDPRFALAGAELGFLQITAGDQDAARRVLQSVLEAGRPTPSTLAGTAWKGLNLVANDRLSLAEKYSGELRRRGGLIGRWGTIVHGLTLMRRGQARQAREDWTEASRAAPRDPRVRMWLGVARMAAGDFDEAMDSFEKARAAWPDLLPAFTMLAECHVRLAELPEARTVLDAMKSIIQEEGIAPRSDPLNPDLMLGSLDLLEGHYRAGLERFKKTLDGLTAGGAHPAVTETLHRTIVEMERDGVSSQDTLELDRQLEVARQALASYEQAFTGDEAARRRAIFLRLKGLIEVKSGDTVGAWRVVEEIASLRDEIASSLYDETYLRAATMLKEGDLDGTIEAFERLADYDGRTVDMIDLARWQTRAHRFAQSRRTFLAVSERLARYAGSWPAADEAQMILTDPHLAALVPVFHYEWARLAYLTGNSAESRREFNRLLTYYRDPDQRLSGMVREARERGAHPESQIRSKRQ